jgi:hypothetical protein
LHTESIYCKLRNKTSCVHLQHGYVLNLSQIIRPEKNQKYINRKDEANRNSGSSMESQESVGSDWEDLVIGQPGPNVNKAPSQQTSVYMDIILLLSIKYTPNTCQTSLI